MVTEVTQSIPSDQDTIVGVEICNFISDHALVKWDSYSLLIPVLRNHLIVTFTMHASSIITCMISKICVPVSSG